MMRFGWVASLVLGCLLAVPVAAQDAPAAEEGLINIFFDCQTMGCFDLDFFRREAPFVNWVRNREDSQVHVLVTSQTTGGGGQMYTLAFIGREQFEGQDLQLTASTAGDAVEDERREAVAGRLKVGLVRYVAGTPAADDLEVAVRGAGEAGGAGGPPTGAAGAQAASQEDDPWNFWVFRIGGNVFANGESSFSSTNLSGNVSANRTTDQWKFNLSGRYNRSENNFEVGGGETVTSLVENWSSTGLLVKSVSDHWSAGVRTRAGADSRRNEDFRLSVSPGVEYNIFPYTESTRRSLTLQALLNVRYWDYETETIYGQTEETRVAPSITAAIEQIQPWGRANVSLTGSQYLHDRDLYNVTVGGFVQVRLFRGFSVNVNGQYSWIRDDLFPAATGATKDEILTRQLQLQTSFRYFTVIGFSYQFGSIFNNVVNPRFGGGGGGFFFF